jgi:[protein-PII] uridylyltransferase
VILPTPSRALLTLKADVSQFLRVARERHRRGEDPFRVVQGFSDSMDGVLRQLFLEKLEAARDQVALIAVGGYGRRELCPYSDIDLLFLRERPQCDPLIEKVVQLLWDGGFQLGHSVRTAAECFQFMCDDFVTAAALLESRFIAGSERLYARFRAVALNRYRKRRGEAFARAKLESLRQSLEDPSRTIYVIEPHLKDGLCCLRDLQRVLWIENIRRGAESFEELAAGGNFAAEHVKALREAYAFYLRVRCELHFRNGLRQDILERDSVHEIARNLGCGGEDQSAAERLMSEYYRHARQTLRFLRHYLETGTQGRRFLGRLAHKLFAVEIKPHLLLHKGILFLSGEPEGALNEEILEIFSVAHQKDARLSEGLCEWIRRKVQDPALDFTRSTVVYRTLLSILRGGGHSGRILKAMHETGVLDRILPEFGQLNGLVNFDGHHHFTVDEHTLRTLEEMDRLESCQGPADQEFRSVLEGIKDRLPLRLALLLHDIGKASPGQHAVSGSEAAVLICERLGLGEAIVETVEFLVYRHLAMFNLSQARDFTEDRIIQSLARLVATEERLKMLYLLTYIDIVSVGPGTWTSWKGAQLSELYQRTLICLRTGAVPGEDLEAVLAATGLDAAERAKAIEHCRQISNRAYTREALPERMLYHAELVERFLATKEIQVGHHGSVGYDEITFACWDRPHLFADLSGVLFAEGFNVLGARIFSRADGVALDIFHVEVADGVQIEVGQRVARLREKLRRIEAKTAVVEDFVRQKTRTFRAARMGHTGAWRRFYRPLFGPAVAFDNETSDRFTVVEVRAGDRPGLLFDLASALSRLALDVRTAKVSTMIDRAHDVFYVVEADGQKVLNPARLKQIEQELVAEAQSKY